MFTINIRTKDCALYHSEIKLLSRKYGEAVKQSIAIGDELTSNGTHVEFVLELNGDALQVLSFFNGDLLSLRHCHYEPDFDNELDELDELDEV